MSPEWGRLPECDASGLVDAGVCGRDRALAAVEDYGIRADSGAPTVSTAVDRMVAKSRAGRHGAGRSLEQHPVSAGLACQARFIRSVHAGRRMARYAAGQRRRCQVASRMSFWGGGVDAAHPWSARRVRGAVAGTASGGLDHVAGIVEADAVAAAVIDDDAARGLVGGVPGPVALQLQQELQP